VTRLLARSSVFQKTVLLSNLGLTMRWQPQLAVIELHQSNDLSDVGSGLWWKGKYRHTSEGYNFVDLYDDGKHESRYETYG